VFIFSSRRREKDDSEIEAEEPVDPALEADDQE